ncbi:sugar ABC transporter permease [Cnuibacter physcomitrellae]|uniref:carbohydrate ABC transporter permease n=1 Tax=Cnuibacter physcomitrellae TaxID=1619308 RepID=UPI00217607C4|nr:sugar ABC transporter permease [Cnuibacter physcomitrellae]MCS5498368.1 sugar ABC transporter permease [Cnuibacter physcomitrellae]
MTTLTPHLGAEKTTRAPEPAPATPRRRRGGLQPSGFWFLLPALIVSIGLIYFGLGYTVYISTLDWDGISPDPASVGAANYLKALQSPIFWGALWHTAFYLVASFVGQVVIGFVLAVIMHSRLHLKVIYKVIIFIPVVIAPAIMAPVFRQIFAPDGQFNELLHAVGLGGLAQPWLGQSETALPTLIVIAIWQYSGLYFVLYFAAIGQIDPEVLEAARLDGAGNVRVAASIIWPQLRATTLALAMLATINALKLFDMPQLLTAGGPNYSTEFLGTYIYRESIPQYDVGYGGALSILMLVLAMGLAIVFMSRNRDRRSERKAG